MGKQRSKIWRRFLQFKISTWFVLIAILGWAMATRPYLVVIPVEWRRFVFEQIGPVVLPIMGERLNPDLKWPALALVTFFAWKGFWMFRQRRREKAATEI